MFENFNCVFLPIGGGSSLPRKGIEILQQRIVAEKGVILSPGRSHTAESDKHVQKTYLIVNDPLLDKPNWLHRICAALESTQADLINKYTLVRRTYISDCLREKRRLKENDYLIEIRDLISPPVNVPDSSSAPPPICLTSPMSLSSAPMTPENSTDDDPQKDFKAEQPLTGLSDFSSPMSIEYGTHHSPLNAVLENVRV